MALSQTILIVPSTPVFHVSPAYIKVLLMSALDSEGSPLITKPVTSPLYYKHNKDILLDHTFGLKNIYWEIVRTLNFNPKWESKIDQYKENQIKSAMNFLMKRIVREMQKMDAKLIIVYIPYPGNVTPPPRVFMTAIKDMITEKDVSFVNLTTPFLEAKRRHELLSTKDGHPNALANRIIADNVMPVICSLLK
jgi:hypothetical protein